MLGQGQGELVSGGVGVVGGLDKLKVRFHHLDAHIEECSTVLGRAVRRNRVKVDEGLGGGLKRAVGIYVQ